MSRSEQIEKIRQRLKRERPDLYRMVERLVLQLEPYTHQVIEMKEDKDGTFIANI